MRMYHEHGCGSNTLFWNFFFFLKLGSGSYTIPMAYIIPMARESQQGRLKVP